MLVLKDYADLALKDIHCRKDYSPFQTLGFDPEELLQLKEMNKTELTGLMIYCGIHVFNGVPLLVMQEDEMRMGYLAFRQIEVDKKKKAVSLKWGRGMKWFNQVHKIIDLIEDHSI